MRISTTLLASTLSSTALAQSWTTPNAGGWQERLLKMSETRRGPHFISSPPHGRRADTQAECEKPEDGWSGFYTGDATHLAELIRRNQGEGFFSIPVQRALEIDLGETRLCLYNTNTASHAEITGLSLHSQTTDILEFCCPAISENPNW